MDKLRLSGVGGFPLILDDLQFLLGRLSSPDEGIYPALNNLLRGFGDNFIVQGVVASGTSPNVAITAGWVLLDGELVKVDAQTGINTTTDNKFEKVTTFDPRGAKTFLNSSINETYEKNRAVVQGTSGNLDFDSQALGVWQEDAFDTSIYTSNTGTWGPSIITTEVRHFILGKYMTVNMITIGAVSSGPTAFVNIKIPKSKTASFEMDNLMLLKIAGTEEVGIAEISSSDNTILIKRLNGASIPTGSFGVIGQITFEID